MAGVTEHSAAATIECSIVSGDIRDEAVRKPLGCVRTVGGDYAATGTASRARAMRA